VQSEQIPLARGTGKLDGPGKIRARARRRIAAVIDRLA